MEKKRGLVFDSEVYFAKFLKHKFKDDFALDSYRYFEKFDNELKDYKAVFYIVYNNNEFNNMLQLSKRGIPVIASSLNKKIQAKLEKNKDIVVFDASKIKYEMVQQLKSCLSLIL